MTKAQAIQYAMQESQVLVQPNVPLYPPESYSFSISNSTHAGYTSPGKLLLREAVTSEGTFSLSVNKYMQQEQVA